MRVLQKMRMEMIKIVEMIWNLIRICQSIKWTFIQIEKINLKNYLLELREQILNQKGFLMIYMMIVKFLVIILKILLRAPHDRVLLGRSCGARAHGASAILSAGHRDVAALT